MRGAFHADVDLALGDPATVSLATESDLARLPRPIQRYLRTSGVVGHPRVLNLRARMHGRIRSSPSAADHVQRHVPVRAGTLIDPAIEWQADDDSRVRATFRNAGHTIRAELSFNAAGELVNFRSDDRLKTNPDGTMRPLPWSTPMRNYRAFGDVQPGSHGEAIWHESDEPFAYAEIEIDEVSYNVDRR